MSKKLLLGSTAMVGAFALAMPAYADVAVTLSGQVEFNAFAADQETINADDGDDGRGYYFAMDNETVIEAEGAADNGINYSAKVEVELDGGENEVDVDESGLAFWGGFGRVELGRDDGAADNMFTGGEDFQAGTGGIDGDQDNGNLNGVEDSGDAAKVTYFTPRIGGFQVGASFTPDFNDEDDDSDEDADDIENSVDLGANFTTSAGGADITLSAVGVIGSAEDDGDDLEDWGIGGGVEFAGFGIGAGYTVAEDLDEGQNITVGATYGFGPANVSVGYSYDDPEDDDESSVVTFSADYGLFPGVKLKGDIGFNSDDGDADGDSTTAGVVGLQLDY